jgi:hypothetical protein
MRGAGRGATHWHDTKQRRPVKFHYILTVKLNSTPRRLSFTLFLQSAQTSICLTVRQHTVLPLSHLLVRSPDHIPCSRLPETSKYYTGRYESSILTFELLDKLEISQGNRD